MSDRCESPGMADRSNKRPVKGVLLAFYLNMDNNP